MSAPLTSKPSVKPSRLSRTEPLTVKRMVLGAGQSAAKAAFPDRARKATGTAIRAAIRASRNMADYPMPRCKINWRDGNAGGSDQGDFRRQFALGAVTHPDLDLLAFAQFGDAAAAQGLH